MKTNSTTQEERAEEGATGISCPLCALTRAIQLENLVGAEAARHLRRSQKEVLLAVRSAINTAIELAIAYSLVLYVICTSALGFSYSNLSYKKIQTRGPYGIVRHPATTCKLAFFTLAFFRYAEAYDPRWIMCFVFWISWYLCRAVLEERYLRRFPEYQAYMKQTRYRFFPGIA